MTMEELKAELEKKNQTSVQAKINKAVANKVGEIREVKVKMCVYRNPQSGKESTAVFTDKGIFWTGLAQYSNL